MPCEELAVFKPILCYVSLVLYVQDSNLFISSELTTSKIAIFEILHTIWDSDQPLV